MPRRRDPDRRRHNGEGTYSYTKAGRHRWRLTINGRDYEVSDRDEARAKVKLEALKKQLQQGIDVVGGRTPLIDYMARYIADQKHHLKRSTIADYETKAARYICGTLGHYALRDLTRRIIVAWVDAVLEYRTPRGRLWSLNSIRQAKALLDRCLTQAVVEKLLDDNPAASVKVPARRAGDERVIIDDEEGTRALSAEQVAKLLAEVKRCDAHQLEKQDRGRHARSAGLFVLYTLAVRTGMRRGELLGLRWKDVDLDTAVIKVRQQVVRIEKERAITTPKTDEARRDIPIPPDLVHLLRQHKLKIGGGELVFPADDGSGGPRSPNSLTQHARRTYQRLGLAGFTFHDLRATAITLLRDRKVNAETIAAIVGHRDVRTTLGIYAEPTEQSKREALATLSS